MHKENTDGKSTRQKILTIVGIVLCVILVPILIINCILLVKGWTNQDQVPSIAGLSAMIVLTPSMEGDGDDNFNAGDLIICSTDDLDRVKVGDVITFYDPDGSGTSVLTHRIVEVLEQDGKTFYRTKGDANNAADPTPVSADRLIGIYTGFRIPGAGHVAMFMQTTWGLIICVLLPLVLLVGYDALRRAKYAKQHSQDRDELMAELEELRRLKAAQEGADSQTQEASAPAEAAADTSAADSHRPDQAAD